MLMSLFSLATALEDPFDESSPDTLSFFEVKDHILFVSHMSNITVLYIMYLTPNGQLWYSACHCILIRQSVKRGLTIGLGRVGADWTLLHVCS